MTQADSGLLLHCPGCDRDKPRGWFARSGAGRRDSWCRECRAPGKAAHAAKRRGAGVFRVKAGLFNRLLARQAHRCAICGGALYRWVGVGPWAIHIDHVVPVARGGEHVEENLQACHAKCNLAKGST